MAPVNNRRGRGGRGRGQNIPNSQERSDGGSIRRPRGGRFPVNRRRGVWRQRFMSRGFNRSPSDTSGESSTISAVPNEDEDAMIAAREELSRLLPGFEKYYPKGVPKLEMFKEKAACAQKFLEKINFPVTAFQDFVEERHRLGTPTESLYELDIDLMVKDDSLLVEWEGLTTDIYENPDDSINLWSCVAHKIVMEKFHQNMLDNPHCTPQAVPFIRIGFRQSSPVTKLGQVNASLLGKYITVQGTVVKSGDTHLYCRKLSFRCKFCLTETVLMQPDGRFTPPMKCPNDDCHACRPSHFEVNETSVNTRLIPSKRIRIQETFETEMESTSVPRNIDCTLFGDSARSCCCGDSVMLSGILRITKDTLVRGVELLHSAILEVFSIVKLRDSTNATGNNEHPCLTDTDYTTIREIGNRQNVFRQLVNSVAPSLFGLELVKAGLLLAMFGGCFRGNRLVQIRSDINVLLFGDAGKGKSTLLAFVRSASPKGHYICGPSSTRCGLTVTLVKTGDEFLAEPGGLVIAHNGVLCVDEFEKMANNHQSLLESLEQQTVSINKGGVNRTFPAKTTVVAAANPIKGMYDTSKTFMDNTKINEPLLSRFDLIFVFIDKPDEREDQRLANHMRRFQGICSNITGTNATHTTTQLNQNSLLDYIQGKEESERPIDINSLRKYITYAKFYVHPILSSEAKEVIKRYYLQIRADRQMHSSIPVTARALESLVRLAEARARCELRTLVTEQDALQCIEIYDYSFSKIRQDVQPLSLGMTFTGHLKRPKKPNPKHLLEALRKMSHEHQKKIFSKDEIMQTLVALGCPEKMEQFVDILNIGGFIIKKSERVYELL